MSVFGVDASTCAAGCEEVAASRLTEVTDTAVPAGTTTGAAEPAGPDPDELLRRLLLAPFEAGPVGPDAMQDDGNLAGDCDFGLLSADALH